MSADFETVPDLGSFQPQMFVNIDDEEKVLFDPGRVVVARDTQGRPYWLECGVTQEVA